jgi:hypothetical protein
MKRSAWLLALLLLGCGGHSVGTVLTLSGPGVLYLDEQRFHDAAEVVSAGGSLDKAPPLRTGEELRVINQGSKVRILKSLPGGAKVQVVTGMGMFFDGPDPKQPIYRPDSRLEGKVGWLLTRDLH